VLQDIVQLIADVCFTGEFKLVELAGKPNATQQRILRVTESLEMQN
jgi:hypothetical protein